MVIHYLAPSAPGRDGVYRNSACKPLGAIVAGIRPKLFRCVAAPALVTCKTCAAKLAKQEPAR